MMVINHNKIMIRFRMERKTIFPQDQTPNFTPGKGVVVVVVVIPRMALIWLMTRSLIIPIKRSPRESGTPDS